MALYLQDSDVAARYGVSRTSVWRWQKKDPKFPAPVKLSDGCTRWKLADLEAWEASRPAFA